MAAEQGHPEAQLYLGVYYFVGEAVPKDVAEASRWVRMAAEQGLPEAEQLLASFGPNGEVGR